jgi:hypothetical protein
MELSYPGYRLKALRKAAGFKRAVEFTKTVGLIYQTYSAHERHPQSREIRADVAEEYAAIFRGEKNLKGVLPTGCHLDINVTAEWIRFGPTPTSITPAILQSLAAQKIVEFPDLDEPTSIEVEFFDRALIRTIVGRLFEVSPRLDFPPDKFFALLESYHDKIVAAQTDASEDVKVIELELIRKLE